MNKSIIPLALSLLTVCFCYATIVATNEHSTIVANSSCPDFIDGFQLLGEFQGSKYYSSTARKSWLDAQAETATIGGYLVSIGSAEENDFLHDRLQNRIVHIGYSDVDNDTSWDSGEGVTYTNFAANSASIGYAQMNFWAGTWTLKANGEWKHYVIEIPCDEGGNEDEDEIGNECGFFKTYENLNLTDSEVEETAIAYRFSSTNTLIEFSKKGEFLQQEEDLTNTAVDYAVRSTGNEITMTAEDATGNRLFESVFNIPYNDPTAVVINGGVRVLSDGLLFGGFIVDYNIANTFQAFIVKTDLNGQNSRFLLLDELYDTFTLGRLIEDENGRIYTFWLTPGNFSVACTDAALSYSWTQKIAADTPSTDVYSIIASTDRSKLYVTKVDNFRTTLFVLDAQTGASIGAGFDENAVFEPNPMRYANQAYVLPLNNGNIIFTRDLQYGEITPSGTVLWFNVIESEDIAGLRPVLETQDGGYLFVPVLANAWPPHTHAYLLKTDAAGQFDIADCTPLTDLPDLRVANINNLPTSAATDDIVRFNFDLINDGTSIATGEYSIKIYLSENATFDENDVEVGEIITGNTPVGTISNVQAAINLASINRGTYTLLVVVDQLQIIAESDESNNSLSATLEITSSNEQDCSPFISAFQSLGEFNGSAYFISNTRIRPTDGQNVAVEHGGYLASIGSQAENDFLRSKISAICYIGLNDAQTEGTLAWDSGETLTYQNFNICSFCKPNTTDNDYVVLANWDGTWSYSSRFNKRKCLIEIPCGSGLAKPIIAANNPAKAEVLELSPNPASDIILLKIQNPTLQNSLLSVHDISGKVVLEQTITLTEGNNEITLPIHQLSAGVYVVKMQHIAQPLRFVKVE